MAAERGQTHRCVGPRGYLIAIVTALLMALSAASGAAATGSITLRVMSFNIFYGGDEPPSTRG